MTSGTLQWYCRSSVFTMGDGSGEQREDVFQLTLSVGDVRAKFRARRKTGVKNKENKRKSAKVAKSSIGTSKRVKPVELLVGTLIYSPFFVLLLLLFFFFKYRVVTLLYCNEDLGKGYP